MLQFKTSNTVKWDGKFIKTNFEVVADADDIGASFNMDLEGDSISKKTLSGHISLCEYVSLII